MSLKKWNNPSLCSWVPLWLIRMWHNTTWYCIHHCIDWGRIWIEISIPGWAMECVLWRFGRNWLHYDGTGLFSMAFIVPMHCNKPNITYLLALYSLLNALGACCTCIWSFGSIFQLNRFPLQAIKQKLHMKSKTGEDPTKTDIQQDDKARMLFGGKLTVSWCITPNARTASWKWARN